MGLPLSSWPFVKIATVGQWEFWQEKSPTRDWLFVKKKKKKGMLMQKILAFSIMWCLGEGGKRKAFFYICRAL